MTHDKRDKEHIKEMKGYHKSVVDNLSSAMLAHRLYTEKEELTKYERAKARKWLRGLGHDLDEEFDFGEYLNESLLEVTYTGTPPSGGNTRGYGNVPRANGNEYYIWMMFAYGGPSYGFRVLVDPSMHNWANRYYDHTFVYHDWWVGYEEDALDPIWDDVIGWLDDVYTDDEIFNKMHEAGEEVCNGCGLWFDTKYDGQILCEDCREKYCSSCGEDAEDDHVSYNGGILCSDCAHDTDVCFECGTGIERYGEMVELEGNYICTDCAESKGMFACDNCADWYGPEQWHEVENLSYCDYCHTELIEQKEIEVFPCENCDNTFPEEELHFGNDGFRYCIECIGYVNTVIKKENEQ